MAEAAVSTSNPLISSTAFKVSNTATSSSTSSIRRFIRFLSPCGAYTVSVIVSPTQTTLRTAREARSGTFRSWHRKCYTSRCDATFKLEGAPNPIQTHSEPQSPLWRRLIPPIDKRSAKSFIRTNERIRAREIRVIDENGEQLGVMAPFEALKMARERSLDLVEISPNAVPPVCKIQDYGKFLYEKDKSDRAARKKQKIIVIKEVKFSVTVDEHDYQTKKNQAVRFLGEGDKVKASLRFKGRQMAHRDLGYKIINRLILDIGDAGLVEFMPRMEGTTLHAILAPSKKAEAAPVKKQAPASEAPAAPAEPTSVPAQA
ncbi:MAG TPA: translation initiation factor IF-3 [Edaphobacter sp.]|nr:translation initiation factor IF-3 [Edaphobacter sp.]